MDARKFVDNFGAIVEAPGGIQRLREMAVGLGVRGELPTRCATDEPASAVVDRARAELGLTGPLPANAEVSTEADALPPGWARAEISEITDHQLGKMLNKNTMTGQPVRYLRSVNIRDGFIDLSDLNEMLMEEHELEKYLVRDGDVLVIEGGDAGRSAVWAGPNPEGMTFQNQLHRLRPLAGILPAFLLLALRYHRSTGEIAARSTGMTIKHFSATALRSLPILVPPLAEQERIVAKVGELMTLCNELDERQMRRDSTIAAFLGSALDALADAETDDDLRCAWKRVDNHWPALTDDSSCTTGIGQTILQLMVTGRLSRHEPGGEGAAALLSRATMERQALLDKRETRVVSDDPSYNRTETLPRGWLWAPLQDLVRFIDYRGRTPAKTEQGIPLVTAKNIRRGYISETPREFIAEQDFDRWMTRGLPRVGDVLFTTEAPMGHAALIREDRKFALAQRTITLAPYADFSGAFLELVLLSPWFRDELAARATGMTATGIKAAKLRLIRIPVPPPAEQALIVATTTQLLQRSDALGAALERRSQSAEAVSAALTGVPA